MLKLQLNPYSDTVNPPRKEMLWIPSCWRKCWLSGFTGKFGTREFNCRTQIERILLTLALGRIFCFFPQTSILISYFIKVTTSISCLSFSILSHLFLARSFRNGPDIPADQAFLSPGVLASGTSCSIYTSNYSPQTQLCKHYLEQLLSKRRTLLQSLLYYSKLRGILEHKN